MYIANKREVRYTKHNEEYGIYSDIKEIKFSDFIDKAIKNEKDINKSEGYYQFIMTADTETSKVYYDAKDYYLTSPINDKVTKYDSKKLQMIPRIDFVYFWQINVNGTIGYGRHIKEFVELINYITERFKKVYRTNKSGKKFYKKIKLYFFNLGYDYKFFKSYFKDAVIRIGDNINPVKVELTDTVELVDAQALVGNQSLKNSVKDYGVDIPKDGLDHSKLRTPDTKLTARELGYCLDDVYYLTLFLESKWKFDKDIYPKITDIPETKTMEVIYYMKNVVKYVKTTLEEAKELKKSKLIDGTNLFKTENDIHYAIKYKGKFIYYNGYIYHFTTRNKVIVKERLTAYQINIDMIKNRCGKTVGNKEQFKKEYNELKFAFCGGFTHANMNYIGTVIQEKIKHVDLASSYPSEMMTQKYVYSYDQEVNKIDSNDFDNYGYLFKATIYGLESKHSYGLISKHKLIEYDGIKADKDENDFDTITIDNGRVLRAKKIVLYGTEIDYLNWCKIYKWKKIVFDEIRKGKKYYLHPSITETLNHFYTEKCKFKCLVNQYKGDKEKELYYNAKLTLSKQKLNSIYGKTVMDKSKYMIEAINTNKLDISPEEVLDKFYEDSCKFEGKGTFFTYAIGVQVTAYARKRIVDVISNIPDDYFLYCDTDSIFFKDFKGSDDIIKDYNKEMQSEFQEYVKRNNLYDTIKEWVDKDGNQAYPCQYDYEGDIDIFCTMGAKRYIMYYNKKGKMVWEATVAGAPKRITSDILNNMNSTKKIMDYFRQGLKLNENISGKKLHRHVNAEWFFNHFDFIRTGKDIFKIIVNNCEIECSQWVSLYDTGFEMTYSNQVMTVMKHLFKDDLGLDIIPI